MAPEIKLIDEFAMDPLPIDGCKADIYSLGISILCLFCPDQKN